MKKLFYGIVIISLTFMLAACTAIKNNPLTRRQARAYLKSQAGPNLRVPAGLSASKIGDDYSIPPGADLGPMPAKTIPPGITGSEKQLPESLVRMQDDPTGYPAVVVNLPPDKTFSIVNNALGRSEFSITSSSKKLQQFDIRSVKDSKKNYQLHLMAYAQETRIYVTDSAGKKLNPGVAGKISKILYETILGQRTYKPSQYFLKPLF